MTERRAERREAKVIIPLDQYQKLKGLQLLTGPGLSDHVTEALRIYFDDYGTIGTTAHPQDWPSPTRDAAERGPSANFSKTLPDGRRLKQALLDDLAEHGPATTPELVDAYPRSYTSVYSSLADLEAAGKVRHVMAQPDGTRGYPPNIYYLPDPTPFMPRPRTPPHDLRL